MVILYVVVAELLDFGYLHSNGELEGSPQFVPVSDLNSQPLTHVCQRLFSLLLLREKTTLIQNASKQLSYICLLAIYLATGWFRKHMHSFLVDLNNRFLMLGL